MFNTKNPVVPMDLSEKPRIVEHFGQMGGVCVGWLQGLYHGEQLGRKPVRRSTVQQFTSSTTYFPCYYWVLPPKKVLNIHVQQMFNSSTVRP
jgi:hypothetical protein